MTDEDTLLDIADLDALTLDDVDEAPEFMVPPSGKYKLGISAADIQTREKDGETKQAMRLIYFTRETLELNNQEEDEVPVGTLFSENFQATKQGLEFFKTRMKKLLGDDLSGVSIKDMLEFLPKQFGKEGDKDILTTMRKVLSKPDETGNQFENVRFQKIEVVDRV
jgi:hypothetical protein